MPSWKIHEKWCKALGIKEEICKEVNRIIDSPPHDIVDRMLKWGMRSKKIKGFTKEQKALLKKDAEG